MYNGPQNGIGNVIAMEDQDEQGQRQGSFVKKPYENKKESYMQNIFAQIASLAGEKIRQ